MSEEHFRYEEPKFCPVCQMEATKEDLWRTYRRLKFWFCSQQCEDRFIAHPDLYVGSRKTGRSEKQKGRVEIKSHRIVFSKSLDKMEMAKLTDGVQQLMGVKTLKVSPKDMSISYDLMEVSLETIEGQVEQTLGPLETPWVDRVKRSWIHYSEECELEDLAHPPES